MGIPGGAGGGPRGPDGDPGGSEGGPGSPGDGPGGLGVPRRRSPRIAYLLPCSSLACLLVFQYIKNW